MDPQDRDVAPNTQDAQTDVAPVADSGAGTNVDQLRQSKLRKRALQRRQAQAQKSDAAPPAAKPGDAHAPATGGAVTATPAVGAVPAAHQEQAHADDPAARLAALESGIIRLNGEVTSQWNAALDGLSESELQMAGGLAITEWSLLRGLADSLAGTPLASTANALLASARTSLGKLSLGHYNGKAFPMPARDAPGEDPVPAVQATIRHSMKGVTHAREALMLSKGATMQGTPPKLTLPDDKQEMMVTVFGFVKNDTEALAFIEAVLQENGKRQVLTSMKGDAGDAIRDEHETFIANAAMSHSFKDKVSPELVAKARAIADKAQSLVDDKVGLTPLYVALLNAFPVAERGRLLQLLSTEMLLDNMVHLGGDDVEAMIHATPGWESWKFQKGLVTAHTTGEYIKDGVVEAARQAPGAVLSFTAGVYDGLSGLPIIGGIAKRAASNLREVRDVVDDATGASKEGRAYRDIIASTAGNIDSKILQSGAAAELGAGGAASAFQTAQTAGTAYNAATTVQHISAEVLELKNAWTEAEEAWGWWTDTLSEVSATLTDVLADKAGGVSDKEKTQHLIDHASAVLDSTIEKLTKHLTTSSDERVEETRKADAAKERARDIDKAAVQATVPDELKTEVAKLNMAMRRLSNAGDPAVKAALQLEIKQHQAEVQRLATPEAFKNLAKNRAAAEVDRDNQDKAAAAAARNAPPAAAPAGAAPAVAGAGSAPAAGAAPAAPTQGMFRDKIKGLAEQLKESAVELLIGTLKGAKDELVKELTAKLNGKPGARIQVRKIIAEGIGKGAVEMATGLLMSLVNKKVRPWIEGEIEKVVAAHFPELKGITKLFDEPIASVLDYFVGQFKLGDRMEERVVGFIEKVIGGGEEEGEGEGKGEGKGPKENKETKTA